ncbi:MAG: transglutaminase [Gammaproteobacteria bacterium]|nr:transglutaminase [Gammaproteobacteria bacterium]|tara:strand:- start:292 stop:1071 length:780 start_codon:yes stop_codon:yes gene_type:complete
MKLKIASVLNYDLGDTVDLMLQLEAAHIPEQNILETRLDVGEHDHFARVSGEDMIGERIWLRTRGNLEVNYSATVEVSRVLTDYRTLEKVPMHLLPGAAVAYLNESRYCPSHKFLSFVQSEFGETEGGAKIGAIRDWIFDHFSYESGISDTYTTALDTFVERRGVCRDFAHVLVTLSRAAGIPARMASVYALGVNPPDFHAVAEIFLGGEWHLIDATGMASEAGMVKICVGRDAADISFLTAYGSIAVISQSVTVERIS